MKQYSETQRGAVHFSSEQLDELRDKRQKADRKEGEDHDGK